MKSSRKIQLVFVVNLLSLALWSLTGVGCHRKHHGEEGPKMKVTNPLRSDQELSREYVGQVKAIQRIELRAFERGYLQEILVDEGQLVRKDEKMFVIMPSLNKAEFHKAEAEAELAEIEYKNTKALAHRNVVSANELALSKAKFKKAQADLDLAKIHLDFTEVKAPFDGLMDRFHVRLGSLVEEGELLTTLSDTSQVWVYFNVTESDYLDYKTHEDEVKTLPVKLKMANGAVFKEDGKIDTIEAEFNNETGNIAFRASFPNPDMLLRHGETGNIQISFPLKDVLVIPQKATFEILDKKFVYVVDENNTIQSREVKIKEELPHLYVIEHGLKENDKILVEGIGKVEKGQVVQIEFEDPKTIIGKLDLPAE